MPFGLQGAPPTFQRLMDRVTKGMQSYASAYLDDLVVYSCWKDHVSHIRLVLERLRGAGLTVKLSKCQFGMAKCLYLGHVIGSGGMEPEPSKVAAVNRFEIPKTKTQVRA